MEKKTHQESEPLIPFKETVDVDLFFSGARRRAILEEIKKSIADTVSVITITGDEGTGKTMICHMVKKELPQDICCVYLHKTLESFDDVVRVLALQLNTDTSGKPGSTQDLVTDIGLNLKENNIRLIAIFDDAERMYLATIERVRKMLDQLNSEELLFQVIFAGRKNLLENLEQLTICDFGEVTEKHFKLSPLGLSETYAYLNHSVQQRTNGKGKNVFTPEAAKKIFSMAQGNLRMTNMLAAKSLEATDSETSFMVLLENVYSEENESPSQQKIQKIPFPQLLGNKWILGGVGVVLVALVLLIFRGDETADDADQLVAKSETQVQRINDYEQPQKKQDQVADALPPQPKEETQADLQKTPPQEMTATEKETEVKQTAAADFTEDEPAAAAEQKTDTGVEKTEVSGTPPSEEMGAVPAPDVGVSEDAPLENVEAEEAEPPAPIIYIARDKQKIKHALIEQTPAELTEADETVSDDTEIIPAAPDEPENLADTVSTETLGDTVEAETDQAIESDEAEGETAASLGSSPPEAASEEQERVIVSPLAIEEGEKTGTGEEAEIEMAEMAEMAEPPRMEQAAPDSVSTGFLEPSVTQAPEEIVDDLEEAVDVEPVVIDDFKEPVVIDDFKKRTPVQSFVTEADSEMDGAKKIVKIAPVRMISSSASEGVETATQEAYQEEPLTEAPEEQYSFSAHQLFEQRLQAGEKWLTRGTADGHTIQLMALAADRAENYLKERFEQDEFKEVADRLYIVRSRNSRVFVFYGEYPDHEAARQARNTLPVFLQKDDPYPLPVSEAVEKTTSQE